MSKGPRQPPAESVNRPRANGRESNLSALIEHCTAAQSIADAAGERFLSYMLSMTIQAARSLRPDAGSEPDAAS